MPSENEPKKETVRITLPPRPTVGGDSTTPPVKKETVRINLPARPNLGSAPTGEAKKESSKISNLAKPPVLTPKPFAPGATSVPGAPTAPAAPAGLRPPTAPGAPSAPGVPRPPMGAPSAPSIPRPPGAPSAPSAPSAPAAPRPMAPPAGGAPKPPGVPSAPGAPRPPAPAGGAPVVSSSAATEVPAVVKPTAKTNTARIEVPPSPANAPQQTVKIQQTQPMRQPPERTLATTSPVVHTAPLTVDYEEDKTVTMVSIGVLVISLVAFGLQLWTFLGE